MFGTDTFPLRDPRRFALAILDNVFGGGMSSRLFQRVREELGLAYAVFAYKNFYQSSGQLGVYVGTQTASADQAVDAIRAEYDRLAREGLPADELADGKQQLKGQIMLSLESPMARMGRLAGFSLHDDHTVRSTAMLAEVDAVTADEIAAVAAEFFPSDRQTVVRLGTDRACHPERSEGDHVGHDPLHFVQGDTDLHTTCRGPMLIGVPKEIKTNENRIALVPAGAEALVAAGHTVFIEQGGGLGSGFPDEAYTAVGRQDPAHGRRGLEAGRDDHEGEGADRGRSGPGCGGGR